MNKTFHSGETAPESGQYEIRDEKGTYQGEVTVVKGNTFPPTLKPNCNFRLVDKTRGLK